MAESRAKVAVIDYRMGNLFSVEHACAAVGLEPVITSDPGVILSAAGAILPGVGAFGEAMENIGRLGLAEPIRGFIASGRPFMGICLGLQLLFTESDEFGTCKGLGLIPGRVERFPNPGPAGGPVRVPQIGWNRIRSPEGMSGSWEASPLRGIGQGEYMYFVHSFYVKPERASDVLAVTRYGGLEYCSGIRRDNLFAAQFHPEKSAHEGLRIYRNWADDVQQRSLEA
jgi:glutamine amidotransferase